MSSNSTVSFLISKLQTPDHMECPWRSSHLGLSHHFRQYGKRIVRRDRLTGMGFLRQNKTIKSMSRHPPSNKRCTRASHWSSSEGHNPPPSPNTVLVVDADESSYTGSSDGLNDGETNGGFAPATADAENVINISDAVEQGCTIIYFSLFRRQ